ncbi:MAG: sugar phosphate isomerase/epimerase family protein [Rhizobiaceae bacterium]
MLKRSLQTITWGDPQHHLFDSIFGLASGSGFEGVEVGFRRLSQVSIKDVSALLNKHNLKLSACHVGGNLADLTQAADERSALETVLDYLVGLNCEYLIYSGLNVGDDKELDAEITRIRTLAAGCADQGVMLLYHNHDWEFRDGQRIWKRLQAAAIEHLGFAPDLGWAVKGGHEMQALLEEIGSEVKVLHFKDFGSWEEGQNTVHLGTGVVDFAPAWQWLAAQVNRDIWLTAEQDHAEHNDVACRTNGAYLAAQIAELGG